jgi:hypothetical protein
MAVITQSNFKALKSYVRVRLAQGVPIVDADVNEREDIEMFELRAFLKWFVGDGVPDGNDGFRILESLAAAPFTKASNFRISSGLATATTDDEVLPNAGRCLVNGLDAMIDRAIDFRAQELFEFLPPPAAPNTTKPNILSIEAKLKAPRIRADAMDNGPGGTVDVWLDVWDVPVAPADDPGHMIHVGLGIDSCSREKRCWAVRVLPAGTVLAPPHPEFAAGHSYYRIAEIARRGSVDRNVNQADIRDLREQRLLVLPSTLVPDLFNTTVLEYRRGQRRPMISFREAINALIRGEVPATPEVNLTSAIALATTNNLTSRGTFLTPDAIVSVWVADFAGARQVFIGTINRANPGAGFTPASIQQLTTGVRHSAPHAVPLLGGDVLVAYEERVSLTNLEVKLRRGSVVTGTFQPPLDIAVAPGLQQRPFLVPVGTTVASEHVVVMWHDAAAPNPNRWRYNIYQPSSHTLQNPAPLDLSTTTATSQDLHAAKDAAGNIWIAFQAGNDIQVVEFPVTGALSNSTLLATANVDKNPFVLIDSNGDPWVFWVSTTTVAPVAGTINYSRRVAGTWTPVAQIPGIPPGNFTSNAPVAVLSDDNAIWVFWDSFLSAVGPNPPGNKDIWYARLNPVSGVWSGSQPTTGTALPDQDAVALTNGVGGDGVIWLLWARANNNTAPTDSDVFFRRLITTV